MDEPSSPFRVTRSGGAGLSANQVRAARFTAPVRGVRAPRDVRADDRMMALAAGLSMPTGAFLCGATAAHLLELPLPSRIASGSLAIATREDAVHLERIGWVCRRLRVADDELIVLDGVPLTSPVRTFLDLAWDLREHHLIAVGDAVMRLWGATQHDFLDHLDRRLRYPGKVRARDVIPHLTPLAESPQESRLRGLVIGAGLPAPTPQIEVRSISGAPIARVDLGYEDVRLALEYDGAHHWSAEQYRADARRRSDLRVAGWTVLEIVAEDLQPPHSAIEKVAQALDHLMPGGLSWGDRPWTPRQRARHRDPWER